MHMVGAFWSIHDLQDFWVLPPPSALIHCFVPPAPPKLCHRSLLRHRTSFFLVTPPIRFSDQIHDFDSVCLWIARELMEEEEGKLLWAKLPPIARATRSVTGHR
jgi:hypothetical protein